jgi:hypothetical protein
MLELKLENVFTTFLLYLYICINLTGKKLNDGNIDLLLVVKDP